MKRDGLRVYIPRRRGTAAGCERTDHRGEAGWGNLHVFQGTGDFVCLGLLDVKAQAIR